MWETGEGDLPYEEEAMRAHAKEMVFPIGAPNDGFAQYFSGRSFLAPISTSQAVSYTHLMSIEELPSKYLMHKIKCKRSPNTVKRTAFSICYYMKYMACLLYTSVF